MDMDMGAMNASAKRDGEIMHEWDLSWFADVIGRRSRSGTRREIKWEV
jgi:hypothetical protein